MLSDILIYHMYIQIINYYIKIYLKKYIIKIQYIIII